MLESGKEYVATFVVENRILTVYIDGEIDYSLQLPPTGDLYDINTRYAI